MYLFPEQLYLEKSKKLKQRQTRARMGSARDAFFGVLGAHRISKGVPKSTIFGKNKKKKEKKEVQKTAFKKHDLLIDFSLNFGWILVSFLMFF